VVAVVVVAVVVVVVAVVGSTSTRGNAVSRQKVPKWGDKH